VEPDTFTFAVVYYGYGVNVCDTNAFTVPGEGIAGQQRNEGKDNCEDYEW
jgi:hypothetical protein